MDEKITPEESLLLISRTIQETKKRFEENGHLIIFWGFLMFVVSLSQFILLQLELDKVIHFEYTIHNWPVFLYPLVGGTYTYLYAWREYKKKNLPKTIIGNIVGAMGWILGINLMILGFFFWQKLGDALPPVFLIFMALFVFITGIAIKYKPLIIGGILLNLIGLSAFYFNWQYHALIMAIGAVIALIIPGILLNRANRKEHV
jgi:hypothetical protein